MKTTNSQQKEELALLIVAAGSSSRMGGTKKEYLPLGEGTVLSTATQTFLKTLSFSVVAVTFPFKEDAELLKLEEEKSKKSTFRRFFCKRSRK